MSLWRFSIFNDAFHAGSARLRHRTKALDRDVKQTARDIARAGVLIQYRAKLRSIFFVPIDQSVYSPAGFRVFGAICEDMFGAAKLWNFGYQYGAARTDQQIRR